MPVHDQEMWCGIRSLAVARTETPDRGKVIHLYPQYSYTRRDLKVEKKHFKWISSPGENLVPC
jgi:hypothetical protein